MFTNIETMTSTCNDLAIQRISEIIKSVKIVTNTYIPGESKDHEFVRGFFRSILLKVLYVDDGYTEEKINLINTVLNDWKKLINRLSLADLVLFVKQHKEVYNDSITHVSHKEIAESLISCFSNYTINEK